MPIVPSSEIEWSPPPRCPKCDVGVTTSGRSMPFAVDANGKVYCRAHGDLVDPTYSTRLREYEAWRTQRMAAIDALEEDARPPAELPTGSDGAE